MGQKINLLFLGSPDKRMHATELGRENPKDSLNAFFFTVGNRNNSNLGNETPCLNCLIRIDRNRAIFR